MITEDYDGYLKKLKTETEQTYQQVVSAGETLRKLRKSLAKKLEKEMISELSQLDLEKSAF